MKKSTLLFSIAALLLLVTGAFAQKTIKGLVDAEKAFASFTETHTIRDGFLKFLDSSGLIFRQGTPVNAIESFTKQQARPTVLSWEPALAIISASGDLGVTTGPFLLRTNSIRDTPVARGNFSSIWKANKEGEWKNVLDLGTNYTRKLPEIKQVQEIILIQPVTTDISLSEILNMDAKFNLAIKEKSSGVFASQLSADSWLNAEGETPISGIQPISNLLLHIPEAMSFASEAGGIASSGDLAYVYGSVINGTKKENYLRVWANRNKRWKVILQTIKW